MIPVKIRKLIIANKEEGMSNAKISRVLTAIPLKKELSIFLISTSIITF